MKKLNRIFLSRKTTVTLIAVQITLYFAGLVIPQKRIMEQAQYLAWQKSWPLLVKLLDSTGLTAIYSSYLLLGATLAFFSQLVYVTWKRIPALRASLRLPERAVVTPAQLEGLDPVRRTVAGEAALDGVRRIVRKRGYAIIEGEGCFRGVKHAWAPLGSLLFHVSFIVVFLGGVLLFHSKVVAIAHVTEGQSFTGAESEYYTITRLSEFSKSLPDVAFRLVKIRPEFQKNEAVSLSTEIEPLRGARKGEKIRFDVNYPYESGTTSMLVQDVGVAPRFEVKGRDGRVLLAAFITLDVMKGDEDSFPIPASPYRVRVRFWPDFAVDANGYLYNRSFYTRRPLFKIWVMKDGAQIADGNLERPGQTLDFDGLSLSFSDIRYFGTFHVTDERGGGILIAGFAIAAAGLILKLGLSRKDVYCLYRPEGEGGELWLACKSEYQKTFGPLETERILAAAQLPGAAGASLTEPA